jgi:murein DD-endopeptidase MepM/ murein hydrolase activator NlpD
MTGFRLLWQALAAIWLVLTLTGCATTSGDTVYLIKLEEGDTLSKIAVKYDTTWQKIAKLNNIKPGTSVKVGTVLRIIPGPGGLVARKAKSGLFARTTEDPDDEDHPDLQQEGEGQRGGLLFGDSGSGSNINWPLYGKISSVYGQRGRRFHHGIDIRAKKGTKIYSAAKGVVEFAGTMNGYGRIVVIRHTNFKTAYAHLNSIEVSQGQKVAGSTIIGEVGTSGNASGPHLHFEVRTLADRSINPYRMLDTKQLLSEK